MDDPNLEEVHPAILALLQHLKEHGREVELQNLKHA